MHAEPTTVRGLVAALAITACGSSDDGVGAHGGTLPDGGGGETTGDASAPPDQGTADANGHTDQAAADARIVEESNDAPYGTCPPGLTFCPGCSGGGSCSSSCPGYQCPQFGSPGCSTCGPAQICVHPTCAMGAPFCLPLDDAGACPSGFQYVAVCTSGSSGPGCRPAPCTDPPPFCANLPSTCGPVPTCSCFGANA